VDYGDYAEVALTRPCASRCQYTLHITNHFKGALIDALAKVHIEFILIHPFRDGNGRLSRLLAIIMALQAGQSMLNFSVMNNKKDQYFSAIQAGLDDYEPMKAIFRLVLHETQLNSNG